MMDHEEYKFLLLSDPEHPTPDMLTHLAGCRECAAYTDRVLRFENRLERALRVDVSGAAAPGVVTPGVATPAGTDGGSSAGAVVQPTSRPRARRWCRGLAVAASVLVAVVMAGGLWLGSAGRTLAADVVDHMAEEPAAWARTEVAVSSPKLEQVMADSNLHLRPGAGLVSYANSCGFRGHQVPHLVLQTAAGPVTIMVLTHESVRGAVHFNEQGYRGMIIPVAGHGSLAVLEQGGRSDPQTLQRAAAALLAAIEWNR